MVSETVQKMGRVAPTALTPWVEIRRALLLLGPRGWAIGAAASVLALIALGIPSVIIENPLFSRMIPVRTQDYVLWAVSAGLIGLITAMFTLPSPGDGGGKLASGGLLSFLAVGCPVCNKIVLLLLGTSGALTYFAPVQIYIGVASVLLLLWTLRLRARSVAGSCALPSDRAAALEPA